LEEIFLNILEWIETSTVAQIVQESMWGYPIVLSSHAVGMAILAGLALMVNIRLLGFANAVPLSPLPTVLKVAFWGFLINFISGALLFIADATHFFLSWPFRIKFILLNVGGACLWLIYKQLRRIDLSSGSRELGKVVPAVAVVSWIGVIVAGRLIAYL
jgi:hypothetical protein